MVEMGICSYRQWPKLFQLGRCRNKLAFYPILTFLFRWIDLFLSIFQHILVTNCITLFPVLLRDRSFLNIWSKMSPMQDQGIIERTEDRSYHKTFVFRPIRVLQSLLYFAFLHGSLPDLCPLSFSIIFFIFGDVSNFSFRCRNRGLKLLYQFTSQFWNFINQNRGILATYPLRGLQILFNLTVTTVNKRV